MAFRVVVQPLAALDVDRSTLFIAEKGNPERARDWSEGVRAAILELADRPETGLPVPEARRLGTQYRHVHYQSHRIVYFIDDETQTVVVVRVYHGARRALRERDL